MKKKKGNKTMSNKNIYQLSKEQNEIDAEFEKLRDHMSPGEVADFNRERASGVTWLRGGFAAVAIVLAALGGLALFG